MLEQFILWFVIILLIILSIWDLAMKKVPAILLVALFWFVIISRAYFGWKHLAFGFLAYCIISIFGKLLNCFKLNTWAEADWRIIRSLAFLIGFNWNLAFFGLILLGVNMVIGIPCVIFKRNVPFVPFITAAFLTVIFL